MLFKLKTHTLLNSLIFYFLFFCIFENIRAESSSGRLTQGFKFYSSWENNQAQDFSEFWVYKSDNLTSDNLKSFNTWYKRAKFKGISPKFGNAFFFKGPSQNDISIDTSGNLVFIRTPDKGATHTMIEPSVNKQPGQGNYISYGGYRFMRLGIPYEIEIEVMAIKGDWIQALPWVLIFQGHSVPNPWDRGKKFNPPFALIISKGKWEAHIRADSRLSLPKDKRYERFDKINLGKVQPDTWTRFRIRVMWGYENYPANGNTALGIWRDGVLYHKEWGRQNFYHTVSLKGDNLGPYLTIGAYTPKFSKEHDAVMIKIKEMVMRSSSVDFSKD